VPLDPGIAVMRIQNAGRRRAARLKVGSLRAQSLSRSEDGWDAACDAAAEAASVYEELSKALPDIVSTSFSLKSEARTKENLEKQQRPLDHFFGGSGRTESNRNIWR
jgi:hypothetical protein